MVKEYYKDRYHDMECSIPQMSIETVGARKAMLFQNALKQCRKEAMEVLREEVQKALKIDIWKPILWDHLNKDEKKTVIPMMANYLENNTFEKFKVRVINRGDKQFMTGETKGLVARIESIKMLLAIAAHENLAIFKVDIGSAFMRTPMVDDVKHKWVRLDRIVVKVLLEL